jgi:hypothetical protein
MHRLRTDPKEVARTWRVVMRRGSLSAAEEITGHKEETIRRGLRAVARQAEALTQVLVHELHLSRVEVAALWSFVKKVSRSWRGARPAGRGGPVLGMSGPLRPRRRKRRRRGYARPAAIVTVRPAGLGSVLVVGAIARRLAVSTGTGDGQGGGGVRPGCRRPGWGWSQAVKRRRLGRVERVEVRPVLGELVAGPYPGHKGRLNGVLRHRWNALTRKTPALAQEVQSWDGLGTVCLFEHHRLRPHPALRGSGDNGRHGRRYRRRTPARAIGLTDHVWTWEEFLTFRHYQYPRE